MIIFSPLQISGSEIVFIDLSTYQPVTILSTDFPLSVISAFSASSRASTGFFTSIREYPCPGYDNFGQFDAMVEKGDVLAMFTGHDHTNAFAVEHKGIDIVNSISTRYIGLAHSTQCGYRIIEIDENNTSAYKTRVARIYDMYTSETVKAEKQNGDKFTYKMAREFAIKGKIQKTASNIYHKVVEAFTDRQVTYPD